MNCLYILAVVASNFLAAPAVGSASVDCEYRASIRCGLVGYVAHSCVVSDYPGQSPVLAGYCDQRRVVDNLYPDPGRDRTVGNRGTGYFRDNRGAARPPGFCLSNRDAHLNAAHQNYACPSRKGGSE